MRYMIASRKIAAAMTLALAGAAPMMAHSDIITLQVPDIPGDAEFATTNGLPPDSIRVLSVVNSVRVAECPVGGDQCNVKPTFDTLNLVKRFSESSPPLFLSVVTGRHAPTATISFYRAVQSVLTKYFIITLQDVTLKSQQLSGSSGASDTEVLSVAYTRISLRDMTTGERACFDVKRNVTC